MKFTNLLRNMILEASRFEVLMDKFVKKPLKRGQQLDPKEIEKEKNKIPKDVFFELIEADPTSRLNNVNLYIALPDDLNKVKVGGYTPWLIKQYLNVTTERQPGDQGYEAEVKQMRERFMEDLYKIPDELKKFERFKGRLPVDKRNIANLSVMELEDLMAPFKLEKTKGTAEEKEVAKKSYEYPGSEVVFRGKNWTIVKITDCGQLGKDAACFFGGYNLKSGVGETNWCTSAPGLSYFENTYCPKGPLYVILPQQDTQYGEKSGLPANRYQFHFQTNSFMDKNDRGIDLINTLNGPMAETKAFFKNEFAKGLTDGTTGDALKITDFEHGAVGKFVALYGLEELFNSVPDNLREITISVPDRTQVDLNIPPSVGRFKNLIYLSLRNCVSKIPPQICECKNLSFVSLIDNPNLRTLPECIADLPKLQILGLKGSEQVFDNLGPAFSREGVNTITTGGKPAYIDFSEVNPETEED
jgi:hypothetical protein